MKTFKATMFIRAETDTDVEEQMEHMDEVTAFRLTDIKNVDGCKMLSGEEKKKCEEID